MIEVFLWNGVRMLKMGLWVSKVKKDDLQIHNYLCSLIFLTAPYLQGNVLYPCSISARKVSRH